MRAGVKTQRTVGRTVGADVPGQARPAAADRVRAYLDLTKPGITRLVVVTAAVGFVLGSPGALDFVVLLHTLIGVTLTASGANALNQFIEREPDGRMRRTAKRPLPSGRLGAGEAFAFALAITALGLLQLVLFVNVVTTLVVATCIGSYLLLYTPLKRRTWHATVVGAVPGALPILAGWTAAGAPVDARGITLFGIVFLWQMPHFFALAWMYREDYLRGGFRMLSAFDPAGARTARQIVAWTIALFALSLVPTFLGMSGVLYFVAASTFGLGFLALGASMIADRNPHRARRVFLGSVVYLPALLALMVVDKLVG